MNAIYRRFIKITVLLIFTCSSALFADIVELKNKQIIEGNIVTETKKFIIIEDKYSGKKKKILRQYIKRVENEITILLKNGRKYEGKILKETRLTITFQEKYTKKKLIIKRKDIKSKLNDIVEQKIPKSFLQLYTPRIMLYPTYSLPMGDIANTIDSGFGARIAYDQILPFITIPKAGLTTYFGGSVGFLTYSGGTDGVTNELTLIPIMLNIQASYDITKSVHPFLSLGVGATLTSLSGTNSGSSTDLTVAGGFGLGINPVPYIEIQLQAQYVIAFEKVNGTYLDISLGVGYKLGY